MFSINTLPYPDLLCHALELQGTQNKHTPEHIRQLFDLNTQVPLAGDEVIKKQIRTLLRHKGFKPRGRDKPASEALYSAVEKGRLSPETPINPIVDLCNAVSLHSGIPMSVVDVNKIKMQDNLTIKACPPDTSYIFNPSGQIIKLDHLLCLHDMEGPFASPVKDAQRTKTDHDSTHCLMIFWCHEALAHHLEQTIGWATTLIKSLDWTSTPVELLTPQ